MTKTIQEQNEFISEFYTFSKYLGEIGSIEDISKYQDDVSAFLLHMSHLKSYQFAESFCKEKSILEIGCNIGYGTKFLAKFAKEVEAIDFDAKVIDFARKNYASPNVKFKEVNATKLPHDDKAFDVVTSFQVIEHINLSDVSNYLSEIHRVLNKDGVALLTTPNRKLRLYPFEKPWNPEHYTEYTAKGFMEILRKHFNSVEVLGLRAEKQIEEIERNRIQKAFHRSFIIRPFGGFLKSILPSVAIRKLKEVKSKLKRPEKPKNLGCKNNFNELAPRFSLDDFHFESSFLGKSLYLLAICKKEELKYEQ